MYWFCGDRRFSLSLDLAEIFKPILGDRLIFSLLNRKQITEKSFTKGLNYLHLSQNASKTIVAELDAKMQTTIKHKDLNKTVSYQYLMRLELILSRLVDTFFSRISLTMQPPPKPHSTACVLPWEEGRHWQSRSSGCSSS